MATFTYGTTSGVSAKDVIHALGKKQIEITVPATFIWGTDEIVVDLKLFGANYITGFQAYEETTAGSVIVAGTGTTSVASGVLTYVSTGSNVATCGGTLIIHAR